MYDKLVNSLRTLLLFASDREITIRRKDEKKFEGRSEYNILRWT